MLLTGADIECAGADGSSGCLLEGNLLKQDDGVDMQSVGVADGRFELKSPYCGSLIECMNTWETEANRGAACWDDDKQLADGPC